MIKPGDYKVACDRCGRWVYASTCKLQWNGLFVCESEWEQTPEADKPQYIPSPNLNVEIPRPKHTLPVNACTTSGSSSVVDYAVAGCAIAGKPYDNVFQTGAGIYA